MRLKSMTPSQLARCAAARLASPKMGEARLKQLESLATTAYRFSLMPKDVHLVAWTEAAARELADADALGEEWGRFYQDIPVLFEKCAAKLASLSEHRVFIDRAGHLRAGARRPAMFALTARHWDAARNAGSSSAKDPHTRPTDAA